MTSSLQEIVTIVCDGPRCAARHDAKYPVSVTFNKTRAQADPTTIPDALVQGFDIVPFGGPVKWCCGRQCSKDYLDYEYVEPKHPRELLKSLELEKKLKTAIETNGTEQPAAPDAGTGGVGPVPSTGTNTEVA